MTTSTKGDSEKPIVSAALIRLIAQYTHDERVRETALSIAKELEQLLEAQEHDDAR